MSATAHHAQDSASLDLDGQFKALEEMTEKELDELLSNWRVEIPEQNTSLNSEVGSSALPRETRASRQDTASLSPKSPIIFTPSSSNSAVLLAPRDGHLHALDCSAAGSYAASNDSNVSPDEYVNVTRFPGDWSSNRPDMNWPPPSTGGCSSQRPSRASSLVPNATLEIQNTSINNSFPWMQSHDQITQAGEDNVAGPGLMSCGTSDGQDVDMMSSLGFFHDDVFPSFDAPLELDYFVNGSMPFASSVQPLHHFNNPPPMVSCRIFPSQPPQNPDPYAHNMPDTINEFGRNVDHQAYTVPQFHQSLTSLPTPHDLHFRRIEKLRMQQEQNAARERSGSAKPDPPNSNASPQKSRIVHRPIAKAEPAGTPPSQSHSHVDEKTKRKGGRRKNVRLNDQNRHNANIMRKVTACWRCALQRDPCNQTLDGKPCNRCLSKYQKGQLQYFGCDRSKLPDFALDFLPLEASMTLMHQKQTIEDCVSEQVRDWYHARPVDIYLTSGYGQALRWTVYEFQPKTDELLNQYQYLQEVSSRQSIRHEKWSPPLGLLKLNTSDETHFENYLDQLLSEDYLQEFGWICFEEESQINDFQPQLLELMCKLYLSPGIDSDLKDLLKDLLRMTIITYIMGHTLTLLEETHYSILTHLTTPHKPPNLPRHTSPRLANRQLKFFFSILRNDLYTKILKWQQQTLRTAGPKENTWLPIFCAMLAFGMVLEEVQRTLLIQADAKAQKREKSEVDAVAEARNACERIDERWGLLVGLFQCKYRNRAWGSRGTFGNQTPVLEGAAEREFCRELRGLVVEKYEHLQSRKDVTFALENQCDYTSRLIARFLLPFLSLPP